MADIQPNWSQLYSNKGIRFGNNAGLDALNQKYNQFQQQRTLDAKTFSDVMAKMNFGGSKAVDLPDLQKQFGDILQTYSKSRTETNPQKQAAISLELKMKQQQMAYDIAQSQQQHAYEQKMLEAGLHPNNYPAEGAAESVQGVINTRTKDPKYQGLLAKAQNGLFDKPVDTDKVGDGIFKRLLDKRVSTGDYKYNPTLQMYERGKTTATALDKGQLDKEWSDYLVNNPRDAHRLMDKWNIPDVKDLAAKLSDNTWESNKGKIHSDTVMEAPKESETEKRENIFLSKKYGAFFSQSQQPTPFRKTVDVLQSVFKGEGDEAANKYADVITNSIQREGLQGNIMHSVKNGIMTIDVPARLDGNTVKQPIRMQFDLNRDDAPSDMQEQLDKAGLKMSQYNQAYKGTGIPQNKPNTQPKHYTVSGGKFKGNYSADKIHEKAVKANMSDQEYVDWLSKQ